MHDRLDRERRRGPQPSRLFEGDVVEVDLGTNRVRPFIDASEQLQGVLLTAALVGRGTGIRLSLLRRTGGRALVVGLTSTQVRLFRSFDSRNQPPGSAVAQRR